MQRIPLLIMMSLISVAGLSQEASLSENTLLWKISGNGLKTPSYLFGTIHMICKDDAGLSANLQKVVREADEVYFEVDLDNLMELMGALKLFKMRGDTSFKQLYTEVEYEKVKTFFSEKSIPIPFRVLETYKPILAASMISELNMPCESSSAMEKEIMEEAKKYNKKIKGLETMGYQADVLDQIPYQIQAAQLLKYIEEAGDTTVTSQSVEFDNMMDAYRAQDLKKLESLITEGDPAISNYTEILLHQRNRNWVDKMKEIMPAKSLLFAVGAGHLPGEQGVIQLLRKMGYTVTPENNDQIRSL